MNVMHGVYVENGVNVKNVMHGIYVENVKYNIYVENVKYNIYVMNVGYDVCVIKFNICYEYYLYDKHQISYKCVVYYEHNIL